MNQITIAPNIHILMPSEVADFSSLTFPMYRHLLTDPQVREIVCAGAVAGDGTPVGLALGMGGPNGEFEMISIHVLPFWRRSGLGRALQDALCDAFATRNYRLAVHFFTVDADDQGFAKFLAACSWRKPIVRQLVCRTDLARAFETPWLRDAPLPDGYSVIAWGEIGAAARVDLKARHAANPSLWPASLDPFHHETGCDQTTSLALLRGDEVVGWVLTHPLDDDTLRWTCSWVIDGLQGAARIVPLWWQVARRQRETSTRPNFIWTVPMEQPRMARFATRRMRPWLDSLGYACTAVRPLGYPTPAHRGIAHN